MRELERAGLFDGIDHEGTIDNGNEQRRFIYRAATRRLHLGGYRYDIAEVPSNLGRGIIRYFTCPFTGLRTRTLYRARPSDPFGHRTAFRPPIGYQSQLAGRRYYLGRSFQLSEQAERLEAEVTRWEYGGQPTRKAARVYELEERAAEYWNRSLLASPLFRRILRLEAKLGDE